MIFSLPHGIRMDVSTAATQIEGGNLNFSWNDWHQKGRITDGTKPATGNDHWEHWQENIELMFQTGLHLSTQCGMGAASAQ